MAIIHEIQISGCFNYHAYKHLSLVEEPLPWLGGGGRERGTDFRYSTYKKVFFFVYKITRECSTRRDIVVVYDVICPLIRENLNRNFHTTDAGLLLQCSGSNRCYLT